MKDNKSYYPFVIVCFLTVVLSGISCTQYDYSSPSPGIVDVHLRTKSTEIPFDPLNNFVLKVTAVDAVRSGDGARVAVYEDLKAIGRTINVYNTLDFRARDSSLIIGQGYAPPGSYVGVNLLIEPGPQAILDGYRVIPVFRLESFEPLLQFRTPFDVKELWTTRINVTVDLDSTLIKGANEYFFRPYYYISHIEYIAPP